MNKRVTGRFLGILLAIYVGSYALLLIPVIQDFSLAGVDQRFFSRWIAAETFIRFFDAITILTATAVLLTFSLFIPRRTLPREPGEVVKTLQSLVFTALLLTVLFAVFQYGVYPRVVSATYGYARATQRAEALLESADTFEKEGDILSAILALEEYLSIWEEDNVAALRLTALRREFALGGENGVLAREFESFISVREQDAGDLYSRALRLVENEAYYSALFYARLARRLNPSRNDISRLILRIENRINPEGQSDRLSRHEERQREVFRAKQAGMEALLRRDPVSAYYIFLQLSDEVPDDPDVIQYLHTAIDGDEELNVPGVRDVSYFLPEAVEVLTLPGYTDLVYLNRWDAEGYQAVSIGKIVYGGSGAYFQDIESITISAEGEVVRHLSAPYGKLVSGAEAPISITLYGIHPEQSDVRRSPQYFVGSREDATGHVLQLDAALQDLEAFDGRLGDRMYTPLGLYRAVQILPQYGFDVLVPAVAFIEALVKPFTFFAAFFFSLGLAVRLHSRYYTRPPLYTWPLIVLLPGAAAYLLQAYEFLMLVMLGASVGSLGFVAGMVILLIAQVLLFTGVLVFASRELMVRD